MRWKQDSLKKLRNGNPFTIIEGEAGKILFSLLDGVEYKYALRNEEGLLRLVEENPFEERKADFPQGCP